MRDYQLMKDLRSIVVRLVVVSFSVAALLGIAALLGADVLGETGARVLGTTCVVGVESIAVLCYLAVGGTRRQMLGVAGGLISLVPFGIMLWLIWAGEFDLDITLRVFGVGLTTAASLAQACLLAAVADQPRPRVKPLLTATFAAMVVLAVMIVIPIVSASDPGDWYWRVLGIVAILDVLGTILVIALQKFSGASSTSVPEPSVITTAAESRLADAAHKRGTTPSALLDELLDRLPEV